MCGRYYIDETTAEDIRQIVRDIDQKINGIKYGDVRPSNPAIVITGREDKLSAEQMKWGFISHQDGHLLINARSENALQRISFSDSVSRRRCIIPAKHFFEWDAGKNKVTFTWKESSTLYMAGFYNRFGDEDRFIILTTKANKSMEKVHDRMPLILGKHQVEEWIYNDQQLKQFLKKESPMLTGYQEYEQLSLF